MPKIIQLSPHVANLIAAGEVVERPASVVKELLENAVDAGASKITLEIRNGGMTFIRVTDNGCGMSPEDAKTAFLRHATSKLRQAEDLAAISTMGFRGEALAAIASVSRIDLLTKTPGSLTGISVHLEGGTLSEECEAGCPDGTTIIVRDLFFNTPARMKFMKADSVEGSRITAALQLQALAHPEVAITFIKDGKQVLSTPGTGGLEAAVYCVYGRECARMIKVDSRWDSYSLEGYVSKPTDARPSRSMQTFFVNDRPVRSKLLIAALEEAYRNQIMVGKFPACVLHLRIPADAVDVNVHPAKTEVKFLSEKSVFDCIHYGVLGALNKTPDRPQVQFARSTPTAPPPSPVSAPKPPVKQDGFFKSMDTAQFKAFSDIVAQAPQPQPKAASATIAKLEQPTPPMIREHILYPQPTIPCAPQPHHVLPETPIAVETSVVNVPKETATNEPETEQTAMEMPQEQTWRMVGELYHSYIIVEEDENAYIIDKHAAHERILFDKLKEKQEAISSQSLLSPVPVRLSPESATELLNNQVLLNELGFEIDAFGENTVLLRQIPMDLSEAHAAETLETLAADLLAGRRESKETIRDELLHTVACKAAIKAGWVSDSLELLALVEQVMAREDLKHCPHGRPICVTLSKKQLEKQFKRS